MEIDEVDYALLAAIEDVDGPVWKKWIPDRLQDEDQSFPGNTDVSSQTVGRRINTMHNEGLVDTQIVNAPDTASNLIIGYELTDSGRDVLNEKRRDIIGSYAFRADQENAVEFIDRDVLLNLLDDELDFTAEEYELLQDHDVEELLVFTLLFHAQRIAYRKLDDTTLTVFRDIIKRLGKTSLILVT